MIAFEDRVLAVLVAGWRLLPPVKAQAHIEAIGLRRLGAKHGSFDPDDGTLLLNSDLFQGENPAQIRMFDLDSNDPPQRMPFVSRALATWMHEAFHAIGAGTELDDSPEWLALSGWVRADDDPQGTARYYENRPGWPQGPSDWRHRLGCWFPREYSSRSPYECFADCCTHIALGWSDFFAAPHPYRDNALAKLRYLRREVWQERGTQALVASRNRWRGRLTLAAQAQRKTRRSMVLPGMAAFEDELIEAIRDVNAAQRQEALAPPFGHFDHDKAGLVLTLAIGPRLLRLYRQTWTRFADDAGVPFTETPGPQYQVAAVERAVVSYLTTTRTMLDVQLAQARGRGAAASTLRHVVETVYDQADTVRAKQMAQTEAHRAVQAAKLGAWETGGTVEYGVWRVGSSKPCGYCTKLDGTRVRIGEPFFLKGATLESTEGKTRVFDYEDVYAPPAHVSCACTIEAE